LYKIIVKKIFPRSTQSIIKGFYFPREILHEILENPGLIIGRAAENHAIVYL
jgi:hypothetical protein